MAQFLAVRDFEKHQHYKDRNPVWIKLYTELLDSDCVEYWELDDSAKLLLIHLWMLASRHGNKIPYKMEWLKRRMPIKSRININPLLKHFIDVVEEEDADVASKVASKTVAQPSKIAMPEIETEKEREIEKETPLPPSGEAASPPVCEIPKSPHPKSGYSPEFEAFWSLYPAQGRKAKGGAWKAWQKLKPDRDLQLRMADAIEKQSQARDVQREADPRAFIPEWKHVATWINGACWEDVAEIIEIKPRSQAETSDEKLRREEAEEDQRLREMGIIR